MNIVGVKHYLSVDEAHCFVDAEIDTPQAAGRDILVRVMAVSVNPVDTKVRSGRGQPADKVETPPRILGWDASGVVEAAGPEVSLFKPGDDWVTHLGADHVINHHEDMMLNSLTPLTQENLHCALRPAY